VSLSDEAAGTVTNTATATATDGLGNKSPASAPSTDTVPAQQPPHPPSPSPTAAPSPSPAPATRATKLIVHKHVDKANAYPGQKLTYTLTVTDDGPEPATDVKITDAPTIAIKLFSIHADHGHCEAAPTITCTLGTLEVGKTAKIEIVAEVKRSGVERNTAIATSTIELLDPEDATSTATTKVAPILRVHKTASAPPGHHRRERDLQHHGQQPDDRRDRQRRRVRRAPQRAAVSTREAGCQRAHRKPVLDDRPPRRGPLGALHGGRERRTRLPRQARQPRHRQGARRPRRGRDCCGDRHASAAPPVPNSIRPLGNRPRSLEFEHPARQGCLLTDGGREQGLDALGVWLLLRLVQTTGVAIREMNPRSGLDQAMCCPASVNGWPPTVNGSSASRRCSGGG
jgi:Domain of unknown function DUF11